MIRLFIACVLMVLQLPGFTQQPQQVKLQISTPQPRINEPFEISLIIDDLRSNIFKSIAGKVRFASDMSLTSNDQFLMKVYAENTGNMELGPLEFTVNNIYYKTNKVSFEVVESLPESDSGLWFRTVRVSETELCIIIDQRMPAKMEERTTETGSKQSGYESEQENFVKYKDLSSIKGLSNSNSKVSSGFSSYPAGNNVTNGYMEIYSVYYFNITDPKAKIKITKDHFENLPAGYVFKDIIIQ